MGESFYHPIPPPPPYGDMKGAIIRVIRSCIVQPFVNHKDVFVRFV